MLDQKLLKLLLIVTGVSIFAAVSLSRLVGWNSSPSAAPVGFYWRSAPHLERGQLVEVCLPSAWAQFAIARGYIGYSWRCPDGSEALAKTVVGMPGDTLWIDPATVLPRDHLGRPMPHVLGREHLKAGEIWLHGSAPNSFDSRYYGAVPIANVIANLSPLWTWDSR
jgi:conjugative transfer signal peptidase TraF